MSTKVTKADVERLHKSVAETITAFGTRRELDELRDTAAQVPALLHENEQLAKGRTDWDKTLGTLKERLLDAFPEADVESIGRRFRGAAPSWTLESTSALAEHVAGLAAQVPALLAQVAELTRESAAAHEALRAVMNECNAVPVDQEDESLRQGAVEVVAWCRERQTNAEEDRDTALSERDALRAQVDELVETVAGMHAQIEERDRDLATTRLAADQLRRDVDEEKTRFEDGESERTDLRSQVDAVPTLVRQALHRHGLSASLCNESAEAVRAALSTPPAEGSHVITQKQLARAVVETLEDPAGNAGARYVDCCASAVDGVVRRLGFGATPPAEVTPDAETMRNPAWCGSCPHPPHLGLCTRRNGQTAWACGCSRQTPPADAKQPEPVAPDAPLKHCAADSDGECADDRCPQRVKRESYCQLARADEAAAEAEGTEGQTDPRGDQRD